MPLPDDDGFSSFESAATAGVGAAPAQTSAPPTSAFDASRSRPLDQALPAEVREPAGQPTQTTTADPGTAAQIAGGGSPTAVRDYLRTKGYQLEDSVNDDQVLSHIEERLSEFSDPDVQRQLALGREYAAHEKQFREYLKSQGASNADANAGAKQMVAAEKRGESAAAVAEKYTVPEYDKAWQKECEWDPQRQCYVPTEAAQRKPGAWDKADKLTAYRNWYIETQQNFFHDPAAFLKKALGEQFPSTEGYVKADQLPQLFNEYAASMGTKNQVYSQIDQNLHRYYEFGPDGQPIVDMKTGQAKETPYGRTFREAATMLRKQYGINDEAALTEMAGALADRWEHAQRGGQQQAQLPAPATNGNGHPAGGDGAALMSPNGNGSANGNGRPRGPDGKFLSAEEANEAHKKSFLDGAAAKANPAGERDGSMQRQQNGQRIARRRTDQEDLDLAFHNAAKEQGIDLPLARGRRSA